MILTHEARAGEERTHAALTSASWLSKNLPWNPDPDAALELSVDSEALLSLRSRRIEKAWP